MAAESNGRSCSIITYCVFSSSSNLAIFVFDLLHAGDRKSVV